MLASAEGSAPTSRSSEPTGYRYRIPGTGYRTATVVCCDALLPDASVHVTTIV
jgi:hypothetical protein